MRYAYEERTYLVYIMASKPYGTLYIGITSDPVSRVQQHRSGEAKRFAHKYKCFALVYFEAFGDVMLAIQREKTLKKWNRGWKIALIENENPHWADLYPSLIGIAGVRTIHGSPGQARG